MHTNAQAQTITNAHKYTFPCVHFLCEHGKVERYVEFVGVQHLSYSPNTAQVTEDVRWVEYERVKATVEML